MKLNLILDNIELAFRAMGGHVWDETNCCCDPDTNMCPCEYCAIHIALKNSQRFVRESILLKSVEHLNVKGILNKNQK